MMTTEVTATIRKALKNRTGKAWSVTRGNGTACGWITITAPASRCGEFGEMSQPDREELTNTLGLSNTVHAQGVMIPAGHDYYREFIDRAQGRLPSATASSTGIDMPLPPDQHDWMQDTVIARAKSLGLSAYAIAKATDGRVSEDHVRGYLTRQSSMGSHKLQHVIAALGLRIVPASLRSACEAMLTSHGSLCRADFATEDAWQRFFDPYLAARDAVLPAPAQAGTPESPKP